MNTDLPPVAALYDYTSRTLPASGTPGAVVVIATRDGVLACRGFGFDGNGQRMTCDTPVVLASLTKGFTAIAAMQLAGAGRIDLDAPVQRYLAWFRVADADASARITVRDLLNQRSGFSESSGRSWLASRASGDDIIEARVRALSNVRLSSSPGTRFEYSNANYDVLGVLVSSVSGITYQRYIQTMVLQPLGIAGARFSCSNDPHGYVRVFSFPVRAGNQPELCADAPAGGLVMSARQYGRYLAANVDAGRGWSSRLLDRGGWQTMQRSPREMPYAMGWFETIYADGSRELRHTGAAPDFHNFAALLPARGIAAARLSDANEMPDGGRSDAIDRGFTRTLEGRSVDPLPAVPLDIYLRLLLGGAIGLQIRTLLRVPKARVHNAVLAAAGIAGAAAIAWYAMTEWGWSPAVGLAYSPDLTVLVVALVALLAFSGVVAVVRLARG